MEDAEIFLVNVRKSIYVAISSPELLDLSNCFVYSLLTIVESKKFCTFL